jgi:hypothetical protein
MGIETGTAILVGSAISAGVSVYSGMAAAAAQRSAAANAAAQQRAAAQAQAEAMRANAQRAMQDVEYSRDRAAIEQRELARKNKILQAERANSAAASGFTVAGTSLERLLTQQEQEDNRTEKVLDWEWTNKIDRQIDSVNLMWHEAEVTEITGYNMANSTYYSGMSEAESTATSGWVKGFGTLGSGAVDAWAKWSE